MGWFKNRRLRRLREQAEMLAPLLAPAKPQNEELLSMVQIINELSKGRLEVMKEESRVELERLKLTAEDRKAEREEERERKQKLKEFRASQAAWAREHRLGKTKGKAALSGIPAAISSCEDCRAALEGRAPSHTNHMFRHHADNHPEWLRAHYESQGIKNAAVSN